MREFTVEPLYRVPERANLTDLVHRNAAELPQHAGLARKVDGRWADVTYARFLAETQATAKGLVALGIAAGDRVAIMSRTSYEWSLLDFAIWEAGAIPVPIYETSSAEQVAWILADSGAVAVFTELTANTATVEAVRDQAGTLKNIWQIDPTGADAPARWPYWRRRARTWPTRCSKSAAPRSSPSRSPPSSTRPAPPAAPRAAC